LHTIVKYFNGACVILLHMLRALRCMCKGGKLRFSLQNFSLPGTNRNTCTIDQIRS